MPSEPIHDRLHAMVDELRGVLGKYEAHLATGNDPIDVKMMIDGKLVRVAQLYFLSPARSTYNYVD